MKKSSGISKKRKVASLSTRDKSEAVAGVETRCFVQMRRARKTRHKSGLTASSFRFRNVYIYLCVCVCARVDIVIESIDRICILTGFYKT